MRGLKGVLMKSTSTFPGFVALCVVGLGSVVAYGVERERSSFAAMMVLLFSILVAILLFGAIRVADPWSRGVVVRLGKFRGLRGPGIFFVLPIVDSVPYWMDMRMRTSALKAEKTLTRDKDSVDVEAVMVWKIADARRAALEVKDYASAVGCATQTALRDAIGRSMLCDLMEGRDEVVTRLGRMLEERVEPWGIEVLSVAVKDVMLVPANVAGSGNGLRAEPPHEIRPGITRANLIRSSGSSL